MKIHHIAALLFVLGAIGAIGVCIFTDWNDSLCLPLALLLSLLGNLCNLLPQWKKNREGDRK